MNKEGLILGELISIHHLTQLPENKGMAHLIEYNDLINKPKETIQDVYDFLNIPNFEHNFESFEQFNIDGHKYNDEIVGDNLHKIKENGLFFFSCRFFFFPRFFHCEMCELCLTFFICI